MLRPIALFVALAFSAAALAQSTGTGGTTTSSASQQVQLLGPQLVSFAGSSGNFESVVNGLANGTPVTLTTVGTDGVVQIVTFLPGTTQSVTDIARNLESARQNLISRGVANPTAQQLAVALVGGTLTTASGSNSLNGVLNGTSLAGSFQVRNEIAGATGLNTIPTSTLQNLRNSLTQGTFSPGRGPMSAFEVNQTLNLAAAALAQQGILNPTPEQLRVALLGGNLTTAAGTQVAVQGVLQGSVRNTSETSLLGTSDTRLLGTSDTASAGGTNPTPPAQPAAGRSTTTTPPPANTPRGSGAGATAAPPATGGAAGRLAR
jgi:hypothetical protein